MLVVPCKGIDIGTEQYAMFSMLTLAMGWPAMAGFIVIVAIEAGTIIGAPEAMLVGG